MRSSTRPLRPIADDEIATFWRDGVVCLRQVMPHDWLARMAAPVEEALAHPAMTDLSEMGAGLASAGATLLVDAPTAARPTRGHFKAGTDHYLDLPEFREFALTSPLGEIVARLLRSNLVQLTRTACWWEPGRRNARPPPGSGTSEGTVCTTWVPPIRSRARRRGAVVVGSHRRANRYRPNFVTTMAMPDTDGDEVPDYRPHHGRRRRSSA
jgi:hypothetical protein